MTLRSFRTAPNAAPPSLGEFGIQHFDQLLADAAERAPLRRLVSIEDVGALCTFMASDASRSMTGSTLYVDAGFHILG